MTALHMAVLVGNADMVSLLVEARANLDIMDGKSGRTAVFHAAESNQYRISSILLQHGRWCMLHLAYILMDKQMFQFNVKYR